MFALEQLDRRVRRRPASDPAFQAEFRRILQRVRRPAVAAVLRRTADEGGRRGAASTSSAKTSTTPAPTRSTTASARRCSPGAWARRGSSPRPGPASTASPPPPPRPCSACRATSTWARRTSAGRSSTSSRCGRWAPRSFPVDQRQPDAARRHQRGDARLDGDGRDTHYIIGSVVGPHPFPMMVRDFQSVIGQETKEQWLEQIGRLPDVVVACVGGGSNAAGMFYPFVDDTRRRTRRRRGRRPRRRSTATTPPRSATASPACCTARSATSCRTTTARPPRSTRSRPASTIPASARSTATGRTPAACATRSVDDDEALDGVPLCAADSKASCPPWRRPTPSSKAMRIAAQASRRTDVVVICFSGRGDKDCSEVARLEETRSH